MAFAPVAAAPTREFAPQEEAPATAVAAPRYPDGYASPEEVAEDPDYLDEDEYYVDERRGTLDFGLLLLRLGLGGFLVLQGLVAFFNWDQSGGIPAIEAQFLSANFRFAEVPWPPHCPRWHCSRVLC